MVANFSALPQINPMPFVGVINDCTHENLVRYYDDYAFPAIDHRFTEKMVREGMEKGDAVFLGSHWSINTAINYYDVPKEKLFFSGWGANLVIEPEGAAPEPDDVCRIIFITTHWVRKGGDMALKVFDALKQKGMKVELHVVGQVAAEIRREHPDVIWHGWFNKSAASEAKQFDAVLRSGSLLFNPTIAEAVGAVNLEAMAYGLPIITNNTGGVPDYVKDGENGLLYEVGTEPDVYAAAIEKLWSDKESYLKMCTTSRKMYEEEFNWDIWGQRLKDVICQQYPEKITNKKP